MGNDPILDRVDKLNVWKRRGERAPHKPLLLLLAWQNNREIPDKFKRYEICGKRGKYPRRDSNARPSVPETDALIH